MYNEARCCATLKDKLEDLEHKSEESRVKQLKEIQWGFCGSGGDYCRNGCQSGPCHTTAGAVPKLSRAFLDQV